jgi:hypothetical protein
MPQKRHRPSPIRQKHARWATSLTDWPGIYRAVAWMPRVLMTSGIFLPSPSRTSAWRSLAMISLVQKSAPHSGLREGARNAGVDLDVAAVRESAECTEGAVGALDQAGPAAAGRQRAGGKARFREGAVSGGDKPRLRLL